VLVIGVPEAATSAPPGFFSGLDEEVPGALRAVWVDALERRLIGRERKLSELLHLVDDELIDADLVDRQHVVFA